MALRLYKGGKMFRKVSMTGVNGAPGYFCCEERAEDVLGLEYLFETEGREFVDPHARCITGREVFGRRKKRLKGVVDFGEVSMMEDEPPKVRFEELFLYELNVRAYTKDRSAKVKNGGTFAGLAEKLPHIKSLGVTGVVLLPAYDFDEIPEQKHLLGCPDGFDAEDAEVSEEMRRVNLWGYGADAFFYAPKASFAADASKCTDEFKTMVIAFHKAGIKVFMDFDLGRIALPERPEVLRFWRHEYHIDGFRVNSAQISPELIASDTRLYGCDFIFNDTMGFNPSDRSQIAAEGLGVASDGFLYDARRFIKSDENMVRAFRDRFCADSETFRQINYITCHNGFTLNDLYSYDVRHNEANGEGGRDGSDYNCSWNCGAEGASRSRKIQALRLRMMKNAFAAVMLSKGVPMILSGDEFMNSQQGNNNAYCQDNKTAWVNWQNDARSRELTDFVRELAELRGRLVGDMCGESGVRDSIWNGRRVSFHGLSPWNPDFGSYSRILGICLEGGESSFYLAFNMHWDEHTFFLPQGRDYRVLLETAEGQLDGTECKYAAPARSITVFEGSKI